MCHNSALENEQIEKCIENGMPTKIISTIKYTMRKRLAEKHTENASNTQKTNSQQETSSPPVALVSKCPFGFGKLIAPEATASFTSVTTTLSATDNEMKFSNNNNNLYMRSPLVSQLSAATDSRSNVIRNLSDHFHDDSEKLLLDMKNPYDGDILAKSTQLTKKFTYTMQQAIRRLQSSKTYTLLTKTTQPAHLVAIGIVSFILLTIWPELIDNKTNSSSQELADQQQQQQHISSVPRQEMSNRKNDMLVLIAYLGAFSTHFGAQIWMTFVSGLALYFSLPRHVFGRCQQILFPKYFAMNAVLSIIMLIIYMKYFISTWTLANYIQSGSLALTSAIELLVRLYLGPSLLRLMHEKYKIEGTIGSGKEIGILVQGDLTKCPHYQRIHKAFRRVHMTVAIGNIITMAGSCLQLYNIAGQLQISIIL